MSRNNEPRINTPAAIDAIRRNAQAELLWRAQAIHLLRLVGEPGVMADRLIAMCREHADAGHQL